MCFSDSSGVTGTDSNVTGTDSNVTGTDSNDSSCNENKINLVQTSIDTASTSSTRPHLSTERGGNSQHRPTCLDGAGKPNILDELTFRNVVIILSLTSLVLIFFALYFIEPFLAKWLGLGV